MPNPIYSGYGEYDTTTLQAVYNVFLPALDEGEYVFSNETIYNISCKDYPNRILMFFSVQQGPNTDLATFTPDGNTNEKATTTVFSLQKPYINDINDSCEPLDLTQDLNLILFHDSDYAISYVEKNLFCQPDGAFETGPAPEEGEGLESGALIPKKGKKGILKAIS